MSTTLSKFVAKVALRMYSACNSQDPPAGILSAISQISHYINGMNVQDLYPDQDVLKVVVLSILSLLWADYHDFDHNDYRVPLVITAMVLLLESITSVWSNCSQFLSVQGYELPDTFTRLNGIAEEYCDGLLGVIWKVLSKRESSQHSLEFNGPAELVKEFGTLAIERDGIVMVAHRSWVIIMGFPHMSEVGFLFVIDRDWL